MATSTSVVASTKKAKPKLGLRNWMLRVIEECDRAGAGLQPDPVHDLRVALRRCRSLADGLMAMDPDPAWKEMKKAGKRLFKALGSLRDMHVLEEWIEKLSDPEDSVAVRLLDHMRTQEAQCTLEAMQELQKFDQKQWRQWSKSLPRRAARVRPGSIAFRHLALEKWTAAHELHRRAMRTRSQTALHELRIGIKRFRYTVENFLPRLHEEWGSDLKGLQDVLGEVHDLDVLWNTATEIGAFQEAESRARWKERVDKERVKRIEGYREKMTGHDSLWQVWRGALPNGAEIRLAGLARLRVWASYLDPDAGHSQRVARISLQLYEGLKRLGLVAQDGERDARAVLHAAALLHDVGKSKGQKGHHKDSFRMIGKLAPPLGWSQRELDLAAVVARYHRGGLPRPGGKAMQPLSTEERRGAVQLAGILRLGNAMDGVGSSKLQVQLQERAIVIEMDGYVPLDRSAEEIAAARHLLEITLRRPVLVRRLRTVRRRGQTANSKAH